MNHMSENDISYRNENVTIMKGLAILLVVLVHSPQKFGDINIIVEQLARFGRWGCQIFFVVSGYTLAASWHRKPKGWKSFYVRRFLVIAPSYYIAILFFQSYAWLCEKAGEDTFIQMTRNPVDIVLNFLLLHGLSSTGFNYVVPGGWYIGTQWIFYLLFPPLMRFFSIFIRKEIDVRWIPGGALILSFSFQLFIAVMTGTAYFSRLGSFLHYSFLNQLPCFLCGICLYYFCAEKKMCYAAFKWYFLKMFMFFFGGAVLFYIFRNVPLIFIFVPVVFAIGACYMFICLETCTKKWRSIFRQAFTFLKKWGEISFAAYYVNFIMVMMLPYYALGYWGLRNSTVLYIITLPFMCLGTYVVAIFYNHILQAINAKMECIKDRIIKCSKYSRKGNNEKTG